jgi:hypothetical protein
MDAICNKCNITNKISQIKVNIVGEYSEIQRKMLSYDAELLESVKYRY